jgi:hypothetical protein
MRRVFFFGVLGYSLAILVVSDLPNATQYTGTQALPFMVKCLIDLSFAAFAGFKMFGSQIHWDDEEVGIHEDDIKLPDAWFYGLFGINLLGNFGWHGYKFATETDATALYYALWFFAEFIAMALTFILYKHSLEVQRREMRRTGASRSGPRAA